MKKFEFSKVIVFVMLIITVCWVSASYYLAYKGLDSNATVTVSVIGTLIVTLVSYYVTKTTEKVSRNKYGLDETGKKIKGGDC